MTWLTSKIQAGDVPVLAKLGRGAKLRDYVQVVFRKNRGADRGVVAAQIPAGAGQFDWEPRWLMGMGIKLGSRRMFTPTGRAVYKGLNVFPGGLLGEPIGRWDGCVAPLEIRTYKYDALFQNARLFVARELSQLPTIAPVPEDVVFNNTVQLIQLREPFALNGWVLSRPVMFAAATCLRSTIIEDLGCHWYPKSLRLLPMPAELNPSLQAEVSAATRDLIDADNDLADRWRHAEALLVGAVLGSVSQLIASGSDLVEGFSLPVHSEGDVLPEEIVMTPSGLEGDDGAFRLTVPHADLRALLWYLIERKRLADGAEVPVSFIGSCQVPSSISAVAEAVRAAHASSSLLEFDTARAKIDGVAARALGLTEDELAYICDRFMTDPFLSRVRPMWAHRGLHVQGYQDHSGGDRFDN